MWDLVSEAMTGEKLDSSTSNELTDLASGEAFVIRYDEFRKELELAWTLGHESWDFDLWMKGEFDEPSPIKKYEFRRYG